MTTPHFCLLENDASLRPMILLIPEYNLNNDLGKIHSIPASLKVTFFGSRARIK
jgi:hypothetical protein